MRAICATARGAFLRGSGLQRHDRTHLPATEHSVCDAVFDGKPLPFADWEFPGAGGGEAMPGVERRAGVLTSAAVAVLGEQRVAALVADGGSGIERLSVGVGGQEGQAAREALRYFDAERVVVTGAAVVDELDTAEVGERRPLGER